MNGSFGQIKFFSFRNERISDNEYVFKKISKHGYEIKSATRQIERLFNE